MFPKQAALSTEIPVSASATPIIPTNITISMLSPIQIADDEPKSRIVSSGFSAPAPISEKEGELTKLPPETVKETKKEAEESNVLFTAKLTPTLQTDKEKDKELKKNLFSNKQPIYSREWKQVC